MIEENGRSRVYLGVRWVFDAFTIDEDNRPDLYRTDENGLHYGGVPLGLQIAENIVLDDKGNPRPAPTNPNLGP